jgi:hypothetical protein
MKKTKDVLKAIYHDYQYTKCLAEHKSISTDEFLIIVDQYMTIIIDEVNNCEE